LKTSRDVQQMLPVIPWRRPGLTALVRHCLACLPRFGKVKKPQGNVTHSLRIPLPSLILLSLIVLLSKASSGSSCSLFSRNVAAHHHHQAFVPDRQHLAASEMNQACSANGSLGGLKHPRHPIDDNLLYGHHISTFCMQ